MNEIPKFAAPQSVTTGPIAGSRKVYVSPIARPDIRVPFREIALSDPSERRAKLRTPRRAIALSAASRSALLSPAKYAM